MTYSSQESHGQYRAGTHSAIVAAARRTDSPKVEASAADRVIVFSDAVVAIAITLLALALPVPVTTHATTNGQLLDGLRANWSEYFAFLISFAVIGSNWSSHRSLFRYVNRMNGQVSGLNMIWLLMMILTPFAARLLSGTGGFSVRFTFYALVQVIAAVCLMQMNRQIAGHNLLRQDAPESARYPDYIPRLALIIMFLVSIPLAFVTPWAFALWAASPLFGRVLERLRADGRHATKDVSY